MPRATATKTAASTRSTSARTTSARTTSARTTSARTTSVRTTEATPPAPPAKAPTRRSRSRVSPRMQPTPPLGSLTQPGARDGVRCAACGSDCVTRLAMTLTDGTPVSFTSCHRCEHRTWTELGGGALPVDSVLDKARKIR